MCNYALTARVNFDGAKFNSQMTSQTFFAVQCSSRNTVGESLMPFLAKLGAFRTLIDDAPMQSNQSLRRLPLNLLDLAPIQRSNVRGGSNALDRNQFHDITIMISRMR